MVWHSLDFYGFWFPLCTMYAMPCEHVHQTRIANVLHYVSPVTNVWWHISATTCQIIMSTCQIFMSTCQIFMSTCQIFLSTCQIFTCSRIQDENVFMPSLCHPVDNIFFWQVNIIIWQVDIISDNSTSLSDKWTSSDKLTSW